MLKAVIFDMDGVIIDSELLHIEATQKTLQYYTVTPSLEYLRQFVGTTVESMYRQIQNDFQITDSLENLLLRDSNYVNEIYELRGMIPVPYVIPFIESLYNNGIRMVIASSSPRQRIEQVTKYFGIDSYFEAFISGCELERPKPAPDIFLKALDILSIKPNEALIIEDSKNGCLAAKAAHIACVGYINPNSGNQDLYSAYAAIESFSSIDTNYLKEVCLRANKEPVIIAKTKRLFIRELSSNDIDAFLRLYQEKEIAQYMDAIDADSQMEADKLKAYFETIYSFYEYGLWGIFLKDTNTLIGCCGIQNQTINKQAELELCYMLSKKYWGNGYALEACRHVLRIADSRYEIKRIVAAIDTQNERSIGLAIKLGMTLEQTVLYHNRSCYLYAIDLIKLGSLKARNQVMKQFRTSPDTTVYSRRYLHKSQKKPPAN